MLFSDSPVGRRVPDLSDGLGPQITEDVPADSLGIARGKQTNKLGWARQKREAAKSKARQIGGYRRDSAVSRTTSSRPLTRTWAPEPTPKVQ